MVPACCWLRCFKGPPGSRQLPFGPRHQAWYAASYTSTTIVGGSGHLSSLSCCLSAAAVRFLAVLSRPGFPPSSRPAYRRLGSSVAPSDLNGVSMFRTGEIRLVSGASLYPGTVVLTWPASKL